VKPFTLAVLLEAGKLTAAESLVFPGKLTVGGHSLNCSHPPLRLPVPVETAIASAMRRAVGRDSLRLQSLGEDGILSSVADLEGAVDYGTAPLARVNGAKVAGKAGSARGSAALGPPGLPASCRAAVRRWRWQ
jgi:hypothetical protein